MAVVAVVAVGRGSAGRPCGTGRNAVRRVPAAAGCAAPGLFPSARARAAAGSGRRPGSRACSPAWLQHSPRYKQGNAPALGAADNMFLGFVLSCIISRALALSCNTPAPPWLSQPRAPALVSLPGGAAWVPHPPPWVEIPRATPDGTFALAALLSNLPKTARGEAQEGTLASKPPVRPSDTDRCHPQPSCPLPTRGQTPRQPNKPGPIQHADTGWLPSPSTHVLCPNMFLETEKRVCSLDLFTCTLKRAAVPGKMRSPRSVAECRCWPEPR